MSRLKSLKFINIFLFGLIVWISYSINDTSPPVKDITYETEYRGEYMRVIWKQGVIDRQCSGIAHRRLFTKIDGVEYSINLKNGAFSRIIERDDFPIFNDQWSTSVALFGTFPANWTYQVHVDYTCNLWQRLFPFTVEWPNVEFQL